MPHPTNPPTGLGAGTGHPGDLPARRGHVLFGIGQGGAEMVSNLGVEPRTQGFSDYGRGCSWIGPITCGFATANAHRLWASWAVWMRFVTVKCPNDHWPTVIWTLGVVWYPVGLAEPDRAAAWGQPSMEPVRASCGSAPRLACGSP